MKNPRLTFSWKLAGARDVSEKIRVALAKRKQYDSLGLDPSTHRRVQCSERAHGSQYYWPGGNDTERLPRKIVFLHGRSGRMT